MKNLEYNEKAFPAGLDEVGGMTLRDYFAAKAMSSLILALSEHYRHDWDELVVRRAYKLADLMLVERNKNEPAQQMQAASP